MCDQPKTAALIDRLFVDGLREAEWSDLRQHLRRCEECRDRYDQLSRVKSALQGDGGLPADQLALLGSEVLRRGTGPARSAARPFIAVAAGGFVLASLAITVLLMRPSQSEYRSRGSAAQPLEGLRAFCIEAGKPPRVAAEAEGGNPIQCRAGNSLQFSYSSGEATFLAIIGVAPSGEIFPYFPRQIGLAPIAPGSIDVPLPYSTPLSGVHPLGRMQIVSVHADRALDAETLERIARGSEAESGVLRVQRMVLIVEPE
jgi:hypothetical protein